MIDLEKGCYAKVIADSIHKGHRLTTMEVQTWRFVLAEFNTHRAFSRNSASSRAIPFHKQLKRLDEMGPAYPWSWPREQKGMQGGDEFDIDSQVGLRYAWDAALKANVQVAQSLHNAGLHKSVVNRLLEPFMWHKIIVSSTDWENFFSQRCSPLAQPEIRVTAEAMRVALDDSTPVEMEDGDWHVPYVQPEDYDLFMELQNKGYDRRMLREVPMQVSAARCARVSYLTHDGRRDVEEDVKLYRKLIWAEPPHWSPLEHVATPERVDCSEPSNFRGWTQLRHIIQQDRKVKG